MPYGTIIGDCGEDATFYWIYMGGGWWTFFLFMPKTMLEVGWSSIL